VRCEWRTADETARTRADLIRRMFCWRRVTATTLIRGDFAGGAVLIARMLVPPMTGAAKM